MAYTNSPLVSYTNISPNRTSPRNHAIDTITIHCFVGQVDVRQGVDIFMPTSKKASCNYVVARDGKIGLCIDEKDRSWCTSNATNDNRAVTIEVASDSAEPYKVTDAAYAALIELVADICKRNGIKKLVWSTDKNQRVNHLNGCNMTVHRDYANKSCPGDYLYNLHGDIAAKVNAKLGVQSKTETAVKTDLSLKVGDIVTFTGHEMFSSASATKAVPCKPGKAEITKISAKSKHPYHLIATKDGTSNVYGWVNAADIHEATPTTTAPVTDVKEHRVKVTVGALNIRSGAGTSFHVAGCIRGGGVFSITEVNGNWGKLKSGQGWICLDYTEKV